VSRRWATAGGLALAAALTLGGCRGEDVTATSGTSPVRQPETSSAPEDLGANPKGWALLLRFGAKGAPAGSFPNSGWSAVEGETATRGGGQVTAARSPHGSALRLPRHSAKDPEFAVLKVTSLGDIDPFSPLDRNFRFGADLSMDDVTTGTPLDNGDNVIQRGLFGGSSQYKIQVDGGRLSCRVAGLSGEVLVRVPDRMTPRDWYRVRCTRRDDTVTLQVRKLARGASHDWTTVSQTGPVGAVIMPSRAPLSIGGKLEGDGTIPRSSTDQFNGRLDSVGFRLLD
jgi:hypothetical protein